MSVPLLDGGGQPPFGFGDHAEDCGRLLGRASGWRAAPDHPGGIPHCSDWVMRDAYSDEVSSCGYWPGGPDEGVFYSYAYPEPDGFRDVAIDTQGAAFDAGLGEFVLPYSVVRRAQDRDAVLLSFLRETSDAAAELGQWPFIQSRQATAPFRKSTD